MINLRKRLSFSVISLLALALCCLVIGQAVSAKITNTETSPEFDGKITQPAVPLPDVDRGNGTGSAAAVTPDDIVQQVPEGDMIPLHHYSDGKTGVVIKKGKNAVTGGEDIGSAVAIASLPFSDVGNTVGTNDDYEEDCGAGGSDAGDVVYSYTPTSVEAITISTCGNPGTMYDTKLFVYENAATPGSPYACNDDACPDFTSTIADMLVTPGNTYYIIVDGWGGSEGDYELTVTTIGDPSGCPVGGVSESEACGGDTNGGCFGPGSFVADPLTPGVPVCGTSWADAGARDNDFFEYTVTDPDGEIISWTATADFPFATYVYDPIGVGCGSFLTAHGWAPYSTGQELMVLPPGTYWFRVAMNLGTLAGYACGTGPSGDYQYNALLTATPLTPEDDCESPGTLVDGSNAVDLTSATPGGGTYGTFLPNNWYAYTATCNGLVTLSMCDAANDAEDFGIGVFDGCELFGGNFITYNDDACGLTGFSPEVSFVGIAGNTYLIEIWTWGGATDMGTIDVSCAPLPLLGDNCPDHELQYTGTVTDELLTNGGADTDGPDDLCDLGADIWVEYTSDCAGEVTVTTCGAVEFDSKMSAYAGFDCLDVSPRDPIACNDDGLTCTANGSTIYLNSPAPGTEFLIRIGGYRATAGQDPATEGAFLLNISCGTPIPRPANDNCADVTPVLVTPNSVYTEFVPSNFDATNNGCLLIPEGTWHAFTLDHCADIVIDLCGTYGLEGSLVSEIHYTVPKIWTACPCQDGTFFSSASTHVWGLCSPAEGGEVEKRDIVNGMLPGTYYYYVSSIPGYQGPYYWNIRDTEIECNYCPSVHNTALCNTPANFEWIDRVQISGIDNMTGCGGTGVDGYADYSRDAPDGDGLVPGGDVFRGLTYNFSVHVSEVHPEDVIAIWVDWNQDYDLNLYNPAEEMVFHGTPGLATVTGSITIPNDAVLGNSGVSGRTVMRVGLMREATDGVTACHGEFLTGETEDYLLVCHELICGDFDNDGDRTAADVTFLKDYYFSEGALPDVQERADINGDCCINIADIVFLADFVHRGGADPICIPCQQP